jgi:glycerophosphoryl diester phosphodiesterase
MQVADVFPSDRVAAIAHRGGAKLRPENTFLAFDQAAALGVDAMECDVHLSRDNVPVVIHDATLDRTTDETGPVNARSAAELATIDAAARFGVEQGFPYRGRGHGVPRLAELLDRHPDVPFIVEIKDDRPADVATVLSVLAASRRPDRFSVGSFHQSVVDVVRRLAPRIPTSASRDEVRHAIRRAYVRIPPRRTGYALFQVPFRFQGRQIFGRPFVRTAVRARVPVQAWIIDAPEDMRRLMAWGVSGLISDRPDIAVQVVRAPGTARL